MAAHFLNTESHAVGFEGTLHRNIKEIETLLARPVVKSDPPVEMAMRLEIADLYGLLGYRQNSNRILRKAASYFRSICRAIQRDSPSALALRSNISLGDMHVELGLNRGSVRQARLGLAVMRRALHERGSLVGAAERASALIRLGTATANAGLLSHEVADFTASAAAYAEARDLVASLDEPRTRARAWWGLAIANLGIGRLE